MCKIKRKPVIDCRNISSAISAHVHDFNYVQFLLPHPESESELLDEVKTEKCLLAYHYIDIVITILGGSSSFLREAESHMEKACVFLVGCERCEWVTGRLSTSEVSEYDPSILEQLKQCRYKIAYTLQDWWGELEDEKRWAEKIVAKAKASFGKPDSRYIAVIYDPKKLSIAIAYQAFLSFLDFAVKQKWLPDSDADQYRTGAKSVFDPDPVEDKPVRRMEQPDVFEDIMRSMYTSPDTNILPSGERLVKSEKKYLGAIRTISGVEYLVMPEERWKAAYLKAARKAGIDVSLAKNNNWELTVFKAVAEAGLIKTPASGYRYRYDLYGDGSRDKTYVVCVPIDVLDPNRNQVEST